MHKFYINGVLLPIAPSSLKIKINDKDEEIDLANGGTMSVLNQPGLTTYSFSFRAPNTKYPFAVYSKGYMEAPAFISLLNKLKMSQTPFTFKVIRGATYVTYRDINTQVSLVDYTISEDADEGGDYIIDVALKEYVKFKNIKTVNGVVVNSGSEDKIIIDETTDRDISLEHITNYYLGAHDYPVEEGDTFQIISQKRFGHMNYAEAIAEHNKMEYTTDELMVGLVINLNPEAIEEIAKKKDEETYEKQKGFWATFRENKEEMGAMGMGPGGSLVNLVNTIGEVYFG